MNVIRQGYKLLYSPVKLPAEVAKKGKVSLVLIPAGSGGTDKLVVLDPKDAEKHAEWVAPYRVSVVGLVFGPQGLSKGKVADLMKKDQDLITQLADYAEHTAQVETLIEALREGESNPSASRNMEAALSGFASRYGTDMRKIDRNMPTNEQAAILIRTLNPALGSYDPLAAQSSTRMQQTAGLAASVAGLFFGSTVGLAGGSAAMALNMRSLLFPDTEFRSALVQSADANGLTMCVKREPAKARTRLAYLWAHRLPDEEAPTVSLGDATHLAIGAKAPVALPKTPEAKTLDRAHNWKLVGGDGQAHPVAVKAGVQALELDLTKNPPPAGDYKLAANWDWTEMQLDGAVHVHALPDLKTTEVAVESRDLLVEGFGPVAMKLSGPDFQFVEKASLKGGAELPLRLPQGKRAGVQTTAEVTVDTSALKAGNYQVVLAHPDGSSVEIPVRVLPPHPKLEGTPLRANLGMPAQALVLRGAGLERIEGIESEQARFDLDPAVKDGKTRKATIHLNEGARKGDKLALALKVEGVHAPLPVANAVEVAGPLPRVVGVEAARPDELGVAVLKGELPAGSFVSFSLRVENLDSAPEVRLRCAEDGRTLQPMELRPGAKNAAARLEASGKDLFFLSFDPGALGQSGCTIAATVETETAGASEPQKLGTVVRLPRIESFTLTDEKIGESAYAGVLVGQDLETIEKAGWLPDQGVPVDGLPKPIAGEGQKQSLRLALPWPSPAPRAPVYIWLRGESAGRVTKARY